MEELKTLIQTYLRHIPAMALFLLIIKGILLLCLQGSYRLVNLLLWLSRRPAITNTNYRSLLTTWQGLALIVLGVATFFVCFALEGMTQIFYSSRLLKEGNPSVRGCISDAIRAIPSFINKEGLLVLAYVVIGAPLSGVGLSISLTRDFSVPVFIMNNIKLSGWKNSLYILLIAVLVIIGFLYLFLPHLVLLKKMKVREALPEARRLMMKNWQYFLWRYLLFMAVIFLLSAVSDFLLLDIPFFLIGRIPLGHLGKRILYVLFASFASLLSELLLAVRIPLYILELTRYYYMFEEGEHLTPNHGAPHEIWRKLMVAWFWLAGFMVFVLGVLFFDDMYPSHDVRIIAHRAGGYLSNENTLSGIEEVKKHDAVFASEIDIQRTADGYYILNHDTDFRRLCNSRKRPGDMTLEEIRKLEVKNTFEPAREAKPVAALDEIMDACGQELTLFIELKGSSADAQMVDDVVRMIQEREMEENTVIMAANYDVVEYCEIMYPEIETGYVFYFSIGKMSNMNCDWLIVEESSISSSAIDDLHNNGQKVAVWTVNSFTSTKKYLNSSVDAIITDDVLQAERIASTIADETDAERILVALDKAK